MMVIAFDRPHPHGAICSAPCKYCGETPDDIGDFATTEETPPIPMKIMRDATYAEYVQQCREADTKLLPAPEGTCYIYWVSVD